MNLPSVSPRERRMLRLAAMILVPSLGYVYGVKPYMESLDAMRDQVIIEQSALARERALVASHMQDPDLLHNAGVAASKTAPLLFEGRDDVIASAGLAAYVTEKAEDSRVHLQQAATRPTVLSAAGVRMLRIEIRGESDLEGILHFLNALETGKKLVRFDKLDISQAPGRRMEEQGFQTLTLAATVSGFAAVDEPVVGKASAPDSARRTAAADAERQRGVQ